MNYFRNLLIAFDQLFNAIRGGYHDNTISAECGYHANKTGKKRWVWLEKIIDWAFEPIDGPNHCWQAYLNDRNEKHYAGTVFSIFVMWAMVLVSIPFIALVVRVYAWAYFDG
ncbi:MAG: hypothetical protein D6711_16995 [Chloroflexi bacterium]|nr:MAG: hypothetical protein D6711_16995 [Chloroflexota bacterium]